ncbi:uncharacterized protein LOC122197909 [Lactuca sativa]|uniref:uncharacterized protein LOC122197909 n=1 Tax=Lactuca sativa TaxID=4236 RepID=UPI001C68B64D|nr:uncharacterized protein LOC122197909 [Lactuca sativa]
MVRSDTLENSEKVRTQTLKFFLKKNMDSTNQYSTFTATPSPSIQYEVIDVEVRQQGLVDGVALEMICDFQHVQEQLLVLEISLPHSEVDEGGNLALYNMKILLIKMSKDILEFLNSMERIEEARGVSATLEERVEIADNTFSLIESYMQLFEVHINTACLHRMQVQSNSGYHI